MTEKWSVAKSAAWCLPWKLPEYSTGTYEDHQKKWEWLRGTPFRHLTPFLTPWQPMSLQQLQEAEKAAQQSTTGRVNFGSKRGSIWGPIRVWARVCQWVATPTPSLPWQRHQHHRKPPARILSMTPHYSHTYDSSLQLWVILWVNPRQVSKIQVPNWVTYSTIRCI